MLNNTFRIAVDPLFPPYEGFSMKKGSIGVEICPENRFDLVFDERVDGEALLKKLSKIGKQEREELEGINDRAPGGPPNGPASGGDSSIVVPEGAFD